MPINLQGSGPIGEGWPGPPQLHAPDIGHLVAAILGNRLARDKMTQENIADTIKNIQGQRQSQAYLEAMQKAGVLPEGDYGALGAAGASDLAKQILAKKVADARAQHLLTTGGRGRSRGGGGGSGVEQEVPEDYYGLSVAPGRHTPGPEIVEKDGVKYLVHRTSKSVTYSRVPDQGAGPQADPTKAMKQQLGNRFSPEDFNPDTVTIEPNEDFNTPSTVTTGTGRKMSLPTFQAGVKAMHGGQQAGVGGYDDTAPTTRPDASKGAPVNLPQVGDQRPGPNGTTVEWDGKGWLVVQ